MVERESSMTVFKILDTDECPVIQQGTEVAIEHVWNFPASNRKFVTIRDVENIPLDRHGNPVPIISTIPYHILTFQEDGV